ncbi:type IV pilin-like G/H family protein [Trichocoleus sp. FACHB-262]|uniref:type IV pilin-like G/H family protein n=1 Tax=Trichocoleus sp. FACHB-262 TaxID=2692869 RepID=UPI0016860C97|nr:type IV pilin-like G/H family protein [Trichocoleus sp. FACHB-262]MBD2124225.1 hypothetical protein [Trichocoleus sp. FACHB-262]
MKRFLVPAAVITFLAANAVILSDSCIFLTMACKRMEADGKAVTETANRVQQVHYFERGKFIESMDALDIGVKSQMNWYAHSMQVTPTSAFFYAVPTGKMASVRRGYVGAVFLNKASKDDIDNVPLEIVCEAVGRKAILKIKPLLQNGSPTCPEGSVQTKRPR